MSPPELEEAREIARMASAAGGRAYLVGGCVRDILLGETPGDLDMEVYSISPAKLEELLARRPPSPAIAGSTSSVSLPSQSGTSP